ncbi:DUF3891 family protein [Paracnuella aquatica]|uniref:DUF3891 family protein n=1 Tax=Paracnuella aquatica TaxID=2268757 RepID=UPI000DEFE6E4|nr:DUF3891 family protein [Paracnuella aquatica]RPD48933.1 DUF3891 family protein [Paracnuella aquatica]
MIVNYTADGWEIITQRAHGVLAAQVAQHWKKDQRPQRWTETLLAIAEHDDALVELEEELLLTEAGGPLNFSMKGFELERCQKLHALSLTKSRYIALLISMHMTFVYGQFAKEDKKAADFLAEQKTLQAQWRKELGLNKEELERIYALMEWCDAFSLLLCQRKVQPEGRTIEISRGPDKAQYNLQQVGEGKLSLQPWPFETESFPVSFESRTIKQLQFTDSAELKNAFLAAPVSETVWELGRGGKAEKTTKVRAR